MDWRSVGAMEEERRVPARARGAEDGGGAAGPSTVKGEIEMFYQKLKKPNCVSSPPHAGPGDAPKGVSPGLGRGTDPFFLCRIVLAQR